MERATNTERGFRRAHARGIAMDGVFTATRAAQELTRAKHFQGGQIPTNVRLSNAAGSPYAADVHPSGRGATLGLAVCFQLSSTATTTWAAASLPTFPARTPEAFLALTLAQVSKPDTNMPSTIRTLKHMIRYPHSIMPLLNIARLRPPKSFAMQRFNSLNSYYAVNAAGDRQAFRYSWIPDLGVQYLTKDDIIRTGEQYLIQEVRQRVADGPVGWHLVFQLAEPDDNVGDATKQWSQGRRQVIVGHLTVTKPSADQDGPESSVFDPTNVIDGIELSEDPILHLRAPVYSESHNRRTEEHKPDGATIGLR
jgi:catalase